MAKAPRRTPRASEEKTSARVATIAGRLQGMDDTQLLKELTGNPNALRAIRSALGSVLSQAPDKATQDWEDRVQADEQPDDERQRSRARQDVVAEVATPTGQPDVTRAQDRSPDFGRTDYRATIQRLGAEAISESEPIFMLRAQDAAAWETVLDWANRAEAMGASPKAVESARRHADAMRRWPVKKVPDLETENDG